METVIGWEWPINVLKIHSLLGLAGYCRRFIFSKLVASMVDLAKKGIGFKWKEECKNVFQELILD